MDHLEDQRKIKRIRLVLLLGTFGVFLWGVLTNDFVLYDDQDYVVKNAHVNRGLSLDNVIWAITTGHAANWHPLTWISHMLDCQIFGLEPAGHHLTSLIFHTASTLLLFGLLRRMTGAIWRSALVAALFGWHPLHVESVAWVAERKDVLSVFFGLLSLGAYWRYLSESKVEGPKAKKEYRWALVWFGLSLLSKPMLVTMPFVLLLLDFWPLRRIADFGLGLAELKREGTVELPAVPLRRLVLEKVPFFILTAGSCLVTFFAQKSAGAVASIHAMTLDERLSNVLLGYVRYLFKMVWPRGLAIYYPLMRPMPLSWVILAALGLLAVTVLVVKNLRRRPWLALGWFWYLGTLVPVVGIVQVGSASIADRYTYLPLIGIFIMLAWSLGELCQRWPQRQKAVQTGVALALAACLMLTWIQVHYWWSTISLFRHAQQVTPPSVVVECVYAQGLIDQKRYEEALVELNKAQQLDPASTEVLYNMGRLSGYQGLDEQAFQYYEMAIKSSPKSGDAHFNLANLLVAHNQLAEATNHYLAVLRITPDSPDAEYNLGAVLVRLGKPDEAMDHLKAALRLQPDYPAAHDQLGGIQMKWGSMDAAEAQYTEAINERPDFAHAHLKLGYILARKGRFTDAKTHLDEAVRLEPTNSLAHFNLAGWYNAKGQLDDAAAEFTKAAQLDPADADSLGRLATVLAQQGKTDAAAEARRKFAGVLAQQGRYEEALQACRDALELKKDSPEALANLAWLLATCPKPELRRGDEALQLAQRACDLGNRNDARFLTPLDAAFAEVGRFDDAIKTALQVQALAVTAKQTALAESAARRLELYRAGKPYHQHSGSAPAEKPGR